LLAICRNQRRSVPIWLACGLAGWLAPLAVAAADCIADMKQPQLPTDPALCQRLEKTVRDPSGLPLDQYETALGDYLRNYCHRRTDAGWTPDKRVRDTGPFVGTIVDGKWVGKYYGTHNPVWVWYSHDMVEWLRRNRPNGEATVANPEPLPDGAMMVKEMFPAPAAACAGIDPINLKPTSGAAIMVRDAKAAFDGWFWGWFGWGKDEWAPDWPPGPDNPLANMGFGQYCTNCHASATDHQTFATLRNLAGERGEPLVYLSQNFFLDLAAAPVPAVTVSRQRIDYDAAFVQHLSWPATARPAHDSVVKLPSETYDNVWMPGNGPSPARQFVTSDQCLGCHDAGSTGLQFDMTRLDRDGKYRNHSPYGTWRSSPMGMAGRDPIFLAQLASEAGTFHKDWSAGVQDTCFGCHGIMGQRQFSIDSHAAANSCPPFLRPQVDAIPYQSNDAAAARYGALARDGISCTTCHRMALGEAASAKVRGEPQNACVAERQALLNPGLKGFAATFTGSFWLAPADVLYGPFAEPKKTPMKHALGIVPEHNSQVRNPALCGSCHVVHLPVLRGAETVGHTYEQTTFAEWAFSGFRTGEGADGPLPLGAGARPQSCQDCHMPSRDARGQPVRAKIASIQELSDFPQTENVLAAEEIDLKIREAFAQHTLVGLNLFFVKMAQQFPDLLGIRTRDPMLTTKGLDPLIETEHKLVEQAAERTADIAVTGVTRTADALEARVTVTNKTGHKLPSGVGFRRAFITFDVLDGKGDVIWSSGRTNPAGMIVDRDGRPIEGEVWWTRHCERRIAPEKRAHQPHYQVVSREDQAQIYQELVSTPPRDATPVCGPSAAPAGELTTSFLSICARVKDNRILPQGFLPLRDRVAIAAAMSAGADLAEEAGPAAVGDDPDYLGGGSDAVLYRVPLDALGGAASVRATLYYQSTPPYFLQDRFCTSQSDDTKRLYFLAGNLDLKGTPAEGWKLELVTTGPVAIP
jgi:hypothetical protein